MSKILYSQDWHNFGKNSINYIGNYWEDNLLMFDEYLQIAKNNKVDYLIDGGDFLEAFHIENHLLDEFIDRIEKVGLDFYFMFGNHNEYFRNKELSKIKSSMGHAMRRSKNFKYLENIKDKDYEILAIDYYQGIEEDLKNKEIIFDDESKWNILLIHAMVTEKEFPWASHITYDQIKTNAQTCLVSHYHHDWKAITQKTEFLDIGCVGRRKINENVIKPKCLLIDTDKRTYEVIELKSAKKGNEIFDLTKVTEEKEIKKDLSKFLESLEDFNFQSMDLRTKIKESAKANNIEKVVVDDILERLNKK